MTKLVQGDQQEYTEFIQNANGLSPAESSDQFRKFRQWYMKPVGLEQAARELGCDPKELSDAIGFQGTKGRLGALVLDGTPIPRQIWERGRFQEAGLLLIEWRKSGKIMPWDKFAPRER
jgi:hypothetical protein